jgi:non-specific serine/threonine protein kinase
MTEEAEPLVRGVDSARWLHRFEEEHDNLRAALEWALGRAPDEALALATAVGGFWYLRGHLTEGCSWLRRALPEARDAATRLRALNLLGWLALRSGDLVSADAALRDCLNLEGLSGIRRWAAEVRNNLGLVAYWRGDFETSVRHFQESVELAHELGDEGSLGQALFNLGLLAYLASDGGDGRALVEESLAILRRLGDRPAMALALGLLGCMALDDGDLATARSSLVEALGITHALGDRVNVLFGLEAFARLAARRGEYRKTLRLAGAAAALRTAVGAITFSLWQSRLDVALDVARRVMGSEASAAAWDEGQAMSLEDAIQLALLVPDAGGAAPQRPSDPLSQRERQIAELVATGLSNRDIAEHLFIAVRTVETHVANVMNKLGFNSRTQISAWVVEQRLTTTRRRRPR